MRGANSFASIQVALCMQAQQSKDAQGSKHGEGATAHVAAPAPTATPQRSTFAPSDMAGTASHNQAPASAPPGPAAHLTTPPSCYPAPPTPAQAAFSTTGNAQPSSEVLVPPGSGLSGPPATQGLLAKPGSEQVPKLKGLATFSCPPAAPEAAQAADLHHPRPTAHSRRTPSSGFIRAVRPVASTTRVQRLGAPTAQGVRPSAWPPRAARGSVPPPGSLTAEPSLNGTWACPETGSPAAYMGLNLPCMLTPADSKKCRTCQSQHGESDFARFATASDPLSSSSELCKYRSAQQPQYVV